MQNICVEHGSVVTRIRWAGKWQHLAEFQPLCHLPANNYENSWKFEVLTKTNIHSFLRHGVQVDQLLQIQRELSDFKGVGHFEAKF